MSLAPASAAATSATPFSASQNASACASGVSPAAGDSIPWPHSQSQLASGSSPASFATVALVFRFCL